MNTCAMKHDTVYYTATTCPACEAIQDLEASFNQALAFLREVEAENEALAALIAAGQAGIPLFKIADAEKCLAH